MTTWTRRGGVIAVLGALIAGSLPAAAQDTLKLAVGQRGNWDTSVSELGQRVGIFKKHGLALEILYTQGGGETQQAVVSGSVDIGVASGIMGAPQPILQGSPVAHHRRRDDRRRRPVLVRAGELADQDAQGHGRQDHRLFDQRLVDARHRHRLHQAVRPEGEAGRHRRPALDPDAGHVRADRRRLVGAALRPGSARRGQDPHHRQRQRRRRLQGADGAHPGRHRADAADAQGRDRRAT